ncbi:hypothetical protein MNBD_NITROSPINAE03-609 [hydrothermal vent metagenome]|uniref:Uncharacterized protein n=1 Tax=hydrothermal vent metagenome TaxID=652676 RepID=A0A3B1CZC3_9ZZZZ
MSLGKLFPHRSVFPLFFITAIGLVYRVILAYGFAHKADAAVLGIMADDIANQIAFPLVYYGQGYMGSIEAWITAPLFFIAGPTWWGLSFAPILVSTLGIFAFYLLGKSAAGDEMAGYIAALLWALPSFAPSFYNITPRGCYPEVVCGGALVLWFATRIWKGERLSPAVCAFFGFLMGILIWTSLLSAPFVMTALLFLFLGDRKNIMSVSNIAVIAGMLAGSAPFVMTISHLALSDTGSFSVANFSERAMALWFTYKHLFLPYSKMAAPSIISISGWIALGLSSVSLLTLFIICFGDFIKRAGDVERSANSSFKAVPVLVFFVLFILIYLLDEKSLFRQTRYLLPLIVPLYIAVAITARQIWTRSRLFAVGLVVMIVTASIANSTWAFARLKQESADEIKLTDRIMNDIENTGFKSLVWIDYERAHRLAFETVIRGVNLNVVDYKSSRDIRKVRLAEKDPDVGVVLTGPPNILKSQLNSCCGPNFKTGSIADWKVLYNMRPKRWPAVSIPPDQWTVNERLKAISDKIFSTTLVSERSFTIELKEPLPITRIRAIWGGRQPVSVDVKISVDGDKWDSIGPPLPPSPFIPIEDKVFFRTLNRYEREYQEWNFPPRTARYIKFDIPEKAAKIYDIHELFIYKHSPGAQKTPALSMSVINDMALRRETKILAANRWIAANIADLAGAGYGVISPSLRSFPDPLMESRQISGEGFSALVDNGDADELKAWLAQRKVEFAIENAGKYKLFTFKGGGRDVWWTGFTIIDY